MALEKDFELIKNIINNNKYQKLQIENEYKNNKENDEKIKELKENMKKPEDNRNPLDKLQDDMREKYEKKPWHRLQNFQRAEKIEKYLKKNYGDKKYFNELLNEIKKHIYEGKFNTKKTIKYNLETYKVEKIKNLKIYKDSYEITGI